MLPEKPGCMATVRSCALTSALSTRFMPARMPRKSNVSFYPDSAHDSGVKYLMMVPVFIVAVIIFGALAAMIFWASVAAFLQ